MPESSPVGVVETAIPAFFYLNGRTPTMRDTGRTGFIVANLKAAENLIVVSEDRDPDDDPVVYFYGIEGVSRVEIHFAPKVKFPYGFVIHQEGLPSTEGTLSPYNDATETFSLELSDPVVEPYDMVLNKSLFDAYPDKEDMTDSQYLRAKNIITSLALWTAIAYQTEDMVPAIAGESAVKSVVFPPAMLAMTSTEAGIAPIEIPLQVADAGVTRALAFAPCSLLPDEDTPSPPSDLPVMMPIDEGDQGPGGGILAFRLERADGGYEWGEVAPQDIGTFRMRDGEAEKACEEYATTSPVDGTEITDWYLPNDGELQLVYDHLYKAGKINCQPDFYWSSTRANATGIYYISVYFLNGDIDGANIGNKYLVLPVRRVSEDEIVAFKKGNG
jgi:hypothetical protein